MATVLLKIFKKFLFLSGDVCVYARDIFIEHGEIHGIAATLMRQIEFHRDDRYEYHRAVEFDEIVIIPAFKTGAGNIQRQFAQGGIAAIAPTSSFSVCTSFAKE